MSTDDDPGRNLTAGDEQGYSIIYDATSDTYHVSLEEDGSVPISVAVIRAIASITGSDPLDLEPLAAYVDPDSLEATFEGPLARASPPSISFTYVGYRITVDSPTEITITS